ncbi:MAG: CbtB-domain containing protein [Gammaproteobacteria bacterium]|nr:CbtB-domain containing protein [Gammaproteobacteria bacterium]
MNFRDSLFFDRLSFFTDQGTYTMNTTRESMGQWTQVQTMSAPWPKVAGIGAALLMGFFILYSVGFASPEIIHNAAHDARHAMAFPCH